jgi:carbon-monoxide dehydrogenase iron sulfur subunit
MCAIVCPFDVLTYHPLAAAFAGAGTAPPDEAVARTVAVKCDGCITRLREGREPACVEVCKVGALTFGEINDVVRDARRRESVAVLATAEPREPARALVPGTVQSWRALGAEAASVGQTGGMR